MSVCLACSSVLVFDEDLTVSLVSSDAMFALQESHPSTFHDLMTTACLAALFRKLHPGMFGAQDKPAN